MIGRTEGWQAFPSACEMAFDRVHYAMCPARKCGVAALQFVPMLGRTEGWQASPSTCETAWERVDVAKP